MRKPTKFTDFFSENGNLEASQFCDFGTNAGLDKYQILTQVEQQTRDNLGVGDENDVFDGNSVISSAGTFQNSKPFRSDNSIVASDGLRNNTVMLRFFMQL